MSIVFNKPATFPKAINYIEEAIRGGKLCGDNAFGRKCEAWFSKRFDIKKSLMTPSCTAALELAALLINIMPGDEVIMPSYTFVSTANAFVLRGAQIVFVDVCADTMNIDHNQIERAITSKTKAIVVVHYAGISCEMDDIMRIAREHDLFVIEDAAQGMMSRYKGRALGTIGHLGTYSFHETKNYTSGGEGGLLIINDEKLIERAEIIREKGTDRKRFFRGAVDKYQWVDIGSSYLPSELQSAYLWSQLEYADTINERRLKIWNNYFEALRSLQERGLISMPNVTDECSHNAHIFYIKVKDLNERTELINFMKERDIQLAFHYVPLHTSEFGRVVGYFSGEDKFTSIESEKLVRLPLWYGLSDSDVAMVTSGIRLFFDENK